MTLMTSDRTLGGRTLGDALAAMVARSDVPDALSHLLAACASAYPADAVAVLVADPHGSLELLSATSHSADELELLQIQSATGPCVEALSEDRAVLASGDEMVERWGQIGTAILAAGFHAVHAYPMHWRGHAIGGLNIFLRRDAGADLELGQMFADLATLAVLQANDLSADHLVSRVHEAVSARSVIEQAKGVLAVRDTVDMDRAYANLLDRARRTGQSLTETAAGVVEGAHRGGDGGGSGD
jgi:hypothetical protein